MVKVAFFSSCGHTELGAMDIFLKRMNSRCHFIRCLPTQDKYKPGLAPKQSGLTGNVLIAEVMRLIRKSSNKYRLYDAIIIEDDLDCRFLRKGKEEVQAEQTDIRKKITEALGLAKAIPIIFLYASPEIEAWFLADWNNTFAKAYGELIPSNSNALFCHQLKKYIDDKILGDYKDDIESYGMVDGSYKKLSDEIVLAIDQVKIEFNAKPEHKNTIGENNEIRYSKALHGVDMLWRADPSEISKHCKQYFKPAFIEIQSLA